MTFRVVVLRRAEAEVGAIALWLADRSPEGALRWLDAFDAAKDTLATNPFGGEVAPESEYVDVEVRHILLKTRRGNRYRALYVVEENDIRILHVRGPGLPLIPPDEM